MWLAAEVRSAARGSAWSGRHPLEKAVLALAAIGAGLAGSTPLTNVATTAAALVLLLGAARVSWRTVLRVASVPTGTVLLAALAVPLEISTHGIAWRDGGVSAATLIVTRSTACSAGALLFALTTDIDDLLHALGRIGLPPWLLETVATTHRFVFVLAERLVVMRVAQAARFGFVNTRATRRSVTLLASNLLSHSVAMARRVEVGHAIRGLQSSLPTAGRYGEPRPVSASLLATVLIAPAVIDAIVR